MVISHQTKGLKIKIQLFCRASFSPFFVPTLHPAVMIYLSILFCYLETQTQVCLCKLASGCQMLPAMALQFCANRDTIVSVISIIMESWMATVCVNLSKKKKSQAIYYPVWKQTDVTMSRHTLTNSAQTHTVFGKPCVCVLLSHTHTDTCELQCLGQETELYKNCAVKHQNVLLAAPTAS